jgi:hypothetical protein
MELFIRNNFVGGLKENPEQEAGIDIAKHRKLDPKFCRICVMIGHHSSGQQVDLS